MPRTERIGPAMTPRLEQEARAWRERGRRPPRIIEPGPGQTSVWDFPRPPAIERVDAAIAVELGGEVIAETAAALRVCETASPPTYYIPAADVRAGCLSPASGSTTCEWKGAAAYFDVNAAGRLARRAAWTYPRPTEEYAALAGHVAFYASRVDRCTIDGEVVRPQPGEFYAGWITADLTGPFKGDPDTEGW